MCAFRRGQEAQRRHMRPRPRSIDDHLLGFFLPGLRRIARSREFERTTALIQESGKRRFQVSPDWRKDSDGSNTTLAKGILLNGANVTCLNQFIAGSRGVRFGRPYRHAKFGLTLCQAYFRRRPPGTSARIASLGGQGRG